MKSKSPFAVKSPLLAYKSDMTGNYANPEYVPRIDVGAAVGAHAAKTADDVFTTVNEADKGKRKAAADKASGRNQNTNTVNINVGGQGSTSNQNTGSGGGEDIGSTPGGRETTPSKTSNTRTEVLENKGGGGFSGQSANSLLGRNLNKQENAWMESEIKRLGGIQQYRDHYKIGKEKDKFHTRTTNTFKDKKLIGSKTENLLKPNSPAAMKGSPVKHNDQQEVSDLQEFQNIMKQPGSLAANATKFFKSRKVDGSAVGSIAGPQPQSSAISRAGLSISGGSTPGGAGLFGAAAQAISADAASQELLPPPNQVAESGSYAGTGDRMLEMDSSLVANQSIGRDTDIASQLFGSGQRASMLAMNGTPLHTEGHGGAKNHTHAKPGEYLDQTVAENMGVNNIEEYEPIQKFKGRQMVVNSKDKDTIFSKNKTFVIPEQMKGITTSPEGTPKYEPKYLNRN